VVQDIVFQNKLNNLCTGDLPGLSRI